ACQITGHASGECVPCPGRIVNVFKRISAAAEELVSFAKEQRAVLAFFNRNIIRTQLSNPTARLDETGFLGDLARFAIVEDKKINALKQRIQVRSGRLDPKVHCVSNDKTRAL